MSKKVLESVRVCRDMERMTQSWPLEIKYMHFKKHPLKMDLMFYLGGGIRYNHYFSLKFLVFSKFSLISIYSVQFSSVAQSYLTLCDPVNPSTPGLPVHHQLPEFT